MSDYVGAFSAGTLGYISGDAKASYKAFKLTLAYLKRKKKMPTTRSQTSANTKRRHDDYLTVGGVGTSSINMLAQRASVKYTNRGALKSIRGNHQYVHVSKALRAKVKKVIKGEDGFGVYYTTRQGSLAVTNALPGNSRNQIDQGGYTGDIVRISPGLNNELGDSRWWQQSLFVESGFTIGDEFQYFTPLKFLDAASILWNNKPISRNYSNQSGNFTNSVTIATGVNLEGNASAPDKKGVDLHVINSYVTWEMKNTSQRLMHLEVYHCVPKVKFPIHLPLETFDSAIAALQESSTTLGTLRSNVPDAVQNDLINNPSVKPKNLEPFSSVFKYEKMNITIAPGETFKHSIQGPKNLDIEFSKLYEGEDDMGGMMWNQSSICAMVSIKPDMVYATAGVGTADDKDGSGRFTARSLAGGGILKDVISVEVKEVFKMSMPDDTGFIAKAFSAGATQTLNLAKKTNAYGNFTQLVRGDVLAYNAHDEQNTAAVIVQSATN